MATGPTFEPLDGRARKAIITLVVAMVVDGVVGVHALVDARMLSRAIADPLSVSDDRLALSDRLTQIGGILEFLTFVLAAIFFLRWFHRATKNLAVLGGRQRYSPAWAVGSWFVPFVNLVVPKRATNDLWRGGERRDDYPAVIDVWWVLWIVSNLMSNVVGRLVFSAEELEEFRTADYVDAVTSATAIVAGVLAILVVRAITRRQAARHEEGPAPRLATGPYRAPADEEFTIEPGWKPAPAND